MVSFDTKTYSKKLLHLISWGHWFTFFNIIAAIGVSSYYLFSETAPETLLGQVYLITTWVSHIGFLTFISFVLILFPLTLILPNTKFIRVSGSIIFTVGLLLLVLDGFIYSRLGYHLNASSSTQIIDLISEQIKQNSAIFYLVSAVLAFCILSFELIASNYAWKHLHKLQRTVFARFIVFGLVLSFFFSHLTHIWADANLDYDILRQDTVLPLSYPATAKTLLTKYGLFNIEDYIERKTSPLSFTKAIPSYPNFSSQCSASNMPLYNKEQSVFIVLTDKHLTTDQIKQFQDRASSQSFSLDHNIDTGLLSEDAWFNLLYSLPSIYQEDILKQNIPPLILQAVASQKFASSFTHIVNVPESNTTNSANESQLTWAKSFFAKQSKLENISTILFADKLNSMAPGLHVFYFESHSSNIEKQVDKSPYYFQLFVDALLLAQQQKKQKDIIWVSSIGNNVNETRLSSKPALLVFPSLDSKADNEISHITSQMDLQPTLMTNWLGCAMPTNTYTTGSNLLTLNKDRVIANTTPKGMMVFNKDKSVFIDQHNNFQSYSRQLEAPITVNADFPLMIDGVHFIKQFNANNQQQP